jgi:MFS family permease
VGTRQSIESRASWVVALASFLIITISFGAPYVTIVALKPMAGDFGGVRQVPALANALAYLGTAVGSISMGWCAARIGMMRTALLGALMVSAGTVVSSLGGAWPLYLGHGLMIGLFGNAALFGPVVTHVSHWFDRRRGLALSFVTSGQLIAGTLWPPIFRITVDWLGWQRTMFWYGALSLLAMLPLTLLLRRRPPGLAEAALDRDAAPGASALGLPPNLVHGLLCIAIVLCCIPMAMPMGHLVAFCSDLGFAPARGADMLALLLGCAFLSRFFWGRLSDRIGGLPTVLLSSAGQAVLLTLYLGVDNLVGLYLVSAALGFGSGGIIPAYILALRQLFPASEAGARIAMLLFFGLGGMAVGGWLAGAIYDWAASYQPAFALGVAANLVNLVIIGGLVWRGAQGDRRSPWPRRAPA